MEILALDIGRSRTGFARASTQARLAEPLKTVETGTVVEELKKLLAEYQVEAIVIGLPRNSSGEDTQQTRWVRQWAKIAKQKVGVPLYWQDEFLTSELAEARNKHTKDNLNGTDAVAASIILEDFLNTDKSARVLV